MTLLALEDLGGDIVGSTTNGTLALTIEFKFGCETEITNLDLHLVVKEEVTKLEISMDDAMTVQVLHSSADLVDVALDLEFVQALTASEQLIQRLVLAQLKEDVHILSVFKEVLEADDVVLVERAVNLDFGHQLLFGSRLGQGRLGNYFGG